MYMDDNIFHNKIVVKSDNNKDEYLDKTCFLNPKYLKKKSNGYDGYDDDYIINKKLKKHLNKIIIITNDAIYGNKINNKNIKRAFNRYLIECVDHIEYEEYNEKLKLENMKETNKQMTGINENENSKYYKADELYCKTKDDCGDCDDCGFIIKNNTKKITMDKFIKKKKCEINQTEVSNAFPIIKKKKFK